MSKGSTGAAAGGGALYGLGIFGALFYYWQQGGGLVLGIRLGDLSEGDLRACVHGLRGVQSTRGVTPKSPRMGTVVTGRPTFEFAQLGPRPPRRRADLRPHPP
jgi:hypothetical protein